MTLLFNVNNCTLIDHGEYISNLFKVVDFSNQTQSFAFNPKIFCIKGDNKALPMKRKKNSETLSIEIDLVKEMYEEFLTEIPADLKAKMYEKYNLTSTDQVRGLSRQLFEGTVFDYSGISGGNNLEQPLKCKVQKNYFLIPQKSRFYCGGVKEQCLKLDGLKFDIVIADPPWWNKFIRRLKSANDKLGYSMMYNEDIASIPVSNLLSANCLIAVWCTNSPSNIAAVKDLIFPAWGVEYVTTWYWMKVSIDMKPLCKFGTGCKKQPYERLILGKVGDLKENPETQMFMSVPSALHSHKPPLLDLLSPYVTEENPQVLELFARYLLPNTTSIGFEPLKWQHLSLYENVS